MRPLGTLAAAAAFLAAALGTRPGAAVAAGRWIPGDLDVHTTYSYDVCKAPPVPNKCDPDHDGHVAPMQSVGSSPIDLIHEAERRGLGFIAFTDHDTPSAGQCGNPAFPGPCSAQNDPDVMTYKACHIATPAACPVLVLDGQEKSLIDDQGFPSGRAGVIGYGGSFPADPSPENGWSVSDLNAAATTIRNQNGVNQGGIVTAFSPADRVWPWRYDPVTVPLDGFEVWNGSWANQREFFGPDAADDPRADDAWQQRASAAAAAGKRLPLLGGSDVHTLADMGYEGPGQPTVWVYDTIDALTAGPTWAGIRDGIVSGHVHVSAEPPIAGPRLSIETANGQMGGDVVPKSNNLSVIVRWQNAPAGATIRFVDAIGKTGMFITVLCDPPAADATALPGYRCNGATTQGGLALQPNPCCRWLRAEMYIEDAAYPQPAAPTGPSRQTACVNASIWGDPSTCFSDRYLLLAVTNPLYSSLV
jgi:hypothetical protein